MSTYTLTAENKEPIVGAILNKSNIFEVNGSPIDGVLSEDKTTYTTKEVVPAKDENSAETTVDTVWTVTEQLSVPAVGGKKRRSSKKSSKNSKKSSKKSSKKTKRSSKKSRKH
jgi:hypothetical protein